ncbi:LysM peptidoglycan-binding domain-containing protein [Thermodesulfobacteriota bacterium]
MNNKMKHAYTIILVSLMITAGCSSEEDTDSSEINTSVRQAIKIPASSDSGKPDSPAAAEELIKTTPDADIKQVKPEKKEGQYIVQKGDSLPDIANKKDVYNSHLKWPILYRDNRKLLAGYKTRQDFPDTGLSSGIILKYIMMIFKRTFGADQKIAMLLISFHLPIWKRSFLIQLHLLIMAFSHI